MTSVHPISDATSDNIYGNFEPADFYARHGVRHVEDFLVNSRGLKQCWRSWVPVDKDIRGVVCVCHGYGADAGWIVQLTCIGIANRGFAVYAIDHQGHGKSQGLKGHIPNIEVVVDDCIAFFDPKVTDCTLLSSIYNSASQVTIFRAVFCSLLDAAWPRIKWISHAHWVRTPNHSLLLPQLGWNFSLQNVCKSCVQRPEHTSHN